mmetsp:Transcript_22675/g.36245  ORF Transcript_22675/g.36245 Transcript_22675/m.36245 type:complete len:501 (+) Transcript_22675:38-1540(+)
MDDNEQESFVENRESTQFDENRLDYSKKVYRDVWCAIIYYLVLATVIGFTIWMWVARWPQIEEYNNNIYNTATDANNAASDATTNTWPNDLDYTGLYVTLISCAVIGIIFGFIWLCILRAIASFLIKIMLFLNIALWAALTAWAFIENETGLGIFAAIMLALLVLYTWCIWGRIRFASVLLELGSMIVGQFSGVVCVQFTAVIFTIIWFAVIAICMWGYFIITAGDAKVDENGNVYYDYNANGWVIFGLVVSLYWSLEVNSNISHTTACGVSAVWYFTPQDRPIRGPTYSAFNRAMTTSFGSICMGSLIVALLEILRAMVNALISEKQNILTCLIQCCLACVEACMRWFNKYAYAHCAIYGVSFMKAAGQTWSLFQREGIMALINDDLSGLGLAAGNLCSLVVCGCSGYGIAYAFYGNYADPEVRDVLVWGLAVYGCVVGFILCWLVLVVVRSAIVTLFVCFAEEPAILFKNRREEFNKLADVRPSIKQIHDNLATMQSV